MRDKEFEIVRDLIAGRAPPVPETTYQGLTLAPVSFREIDGEVLARQYVAHRKFLETEAQARQARTGEVADSSNRPPRLRGEQRLNAGKVAEPSGWFRGLSRFWRR
jgi:hypothetical protein